MRTTILLRSKKTKEEKKEGNQSGVSVSRRSINKCEPSIRRWTSKTPQRPSWRGGESSPAPWTREAITSAAQPHPQPMMLPRSFCYIRTNNNKKSEPVNTSATASLHPGEVAYPYRINMCCLSWQQTILTQEWLLWPHASRLYNLHGTPEYSISTACADSDTPTRTTSSLHIGSTIRKTKLFKLYIAWLLHSLVKFQISNVKTQILWKHTIDAFKWF